MYKLTLASMLSMLPEDPVAAGTYLMSHDIIWIEDPGHAWLRIPDQFLGDFKPSQFSYVGSDTRQVGQRFVYLEEDCDAPGWLKHHNIPFEAVRKLFTRQDKGESPVRRMQSIG
jgi:hypothetical protein